MNKFVKLTVALAGLLSISLPAAFAAEVTPTTPPPATAPGTAPAVHQPMHRGPLARLMIRHRIAQQLGLTDNQKAELKSARQTAAASIKAIRADASLTPAEKRERVHEVLANTRTQMRAVLTPEQQAKLQEIRAHRQQGGGS